MKILLCFVSGDLIISAVHLVFRVIRSKNTKISLSVHCIYFTQNTFLTMLCSVLLSMLLCIIFLCNMFSVLASSGCGHLYLQHFHVVFNFILFVKSDFFLWDLYNCLWFAIFLEWQANEGKYFLSLELLSVLFVGNNLRILQNITKNVCERNYTDCLRKCLCVKKIGKIVCEKYLATSVQFVRTWTRLKDKQDCLRSKNYLNCFKNTDNLRVRNICLKNPC